VTTTTTYLTNTLITRNDIILPAEMLRFCTLLLVLLAAVASAAATST
jgi:hypothetical protein